MAFFGVNFILQIFCPCIKNDKYQVCPYPVDAGGDRGEVGTLIFLFDEVTQAGEGKSWRSCDKSFIFEPGKDEAGYENEHKHQTELTD